MQSRANDSRRSFLKAAAAGVAAAAVLPSLSLGKDADAHDGEHGFGGLPLGLQSYTLRSMSLEKCLDTMVNNLHLKYVEIFPGHHPNTSARQVAEMAQKHGIDIVAYGVVPFSKKTDENRKHFEIGKALGIKSLSCDPDPDAFDSLDKLVEEYKIAAAIHPHGPGHRWAKIETIHDAVKDHHKLIGLCADTGHLIRAEQDPLEALHVFKDRLFGLHLKDFKKLGPDKWEDVPASEGSLDTDAVVKFLLENKFHGAISIEFEGEHPVDATKKTIERVRAAVKKAHAKA